MKDKVGRRGGKEGGSSCRSLSVSFSVLRVCEGLVVHREYLQIYSWGWKRELGFITQQLKLIEGVYKMMFLSGINLDMRT